MARKCVFKVTAMGETFKVVEVKNLGDGPLWAVLKGRVYAPRPFLYQTPDEGIERAVYLAKLELSKNNLLAFEL